MQAVVGSFRVDRILSGTPEELWLVAQRGAYISKQDFDNYFAGVEVGHIILVSCGQRLPTPIKLSLLRVIWPGCKPPRSFGYLITADTYSRRIMSNFRAHLFNAGGPPEECNENNIYGNGLKDRKGSFLLSRDEVRALASLFRAGA